MEGASYALKTFGSQDAWMAKLPNEAFNTKEFLLKNINYNRVYKPLTHTYKYVDNINTHLDNCIYTLKPSCDLFHKVDIYFPTNKCCKLKDFLFGIEIEIGGQRIDKIYSKLYEKESDKINSIETILNTNAELFGSQRRVQYTDSHIIVPLYLAPLYDTNLIPFPKHHEIRIRLEGKFTPYCDIEALTLFAECYYVEETYRKIVNDMKHEYVTFQNIIHSDYHHTVLKEGRNEFRLNFNHPVYCIYLWGFDKSLITRISLLLNDTSKYKYRNSMDEEDIVPILPKEETIYYEGSIVPLEYHKQSRGINSEPVFIFFSDTKLNERPKSTVNFSRLDYPTLIIETEQDDEPDIYLCGLNIQGYRCMSGMFGLVYSK
jgi:hypothetical protein